MPSGIYKRKKKNSKARKKASTKRAATKKKRGPGRPPGPAKKKRGRPKGSKTKKARPIKAATAKAPRKSQGRAGSPRVFADFGAVIEAIHEFGRLLDARSKLLIEATNGIADSIRETADPELPAKVALVEADKKAGAAQAEQPSVS